MIKDKDLEKYHDAACRIETDGAEAYHTVSRLYGTEVANLLLIAHLRKNISRDQSYRVGSLGVEEEVNVYLEKSGLLQKTICGRDLAKSWWENATLEERKSWIESIKETQATRPLSKFSKVLSELCQEEEENLTRG